MNIRTDRACSACERPGQHTHTQVLEGIPIDLCADWRDCLRHWPAADQAAATTPTRR